MELADLVVVMSMGWVKRIGRPPDILGHPTGEYGRDFIAVSRLQGRAPRNGRGCVP